MPVFALHHAQVFCPKAGKQARGGGQIHISVEVGLHLELDQTE